MLDTFITASVAANSIDELSSTLLEYSMLCMSTSANTALSANTYANDITVVAAISVLALST